MTYFWWWLAIITLGARLIKFGLMGLFGRNSSVASLKKMPSVTLIQPITAGASHLEGNLKSRLLQTYHGNLQHLLVCDMSDEGSVKLCTKLISRFKSQNISLLTLRKKSVASKVEKISAAVAKATGEVLVFIDDDIELPPNSLRQLVTQLVRDPVIGAAFGLPSAFGHHNAPTTVMSLVVNYFAPLFYLPLARLIPPFTITGHWYAVRRSVFNEIGGTKIFERRLDDDNFLARQLKRKGYKLLQTTVQYTVHNYFESFSQLFNQLKRWMIFPQQTIAPFLTFKEKLIVSLICLEFLLPFFLSSWPFTILIMGLVYSSYLSLSFLAHRKGFSYRELAWLPLVAVFAPVVMVFLLFTNDHIFSWRGKTIKLHRQGNYDELHT